MLFAICFSFLDLGAPSKIEEFDSEEESSVHFVIQEPVSEVNWEYAMLFVFLPITDRCCYAMLNQPSQLLRLETVAYKQEAAQKAGFNLHLTKHFIVWCRKDRCFSFSRDASWNDMQFTKNHSVESNKQTTDKHKTNYHCVNTDYKASLCLNNGNFIPICKNILEDNCINTSCFLKR